MFDDGHACVAETYYAMAYTLQSQGSLLRSLDCAEKAWNIQKVACGPQSKEVAASANLIGFVQARRGKLEEAIQFLEEAYQIRLGMGDLVKTSESLMNLGNVYREKEDYDMALECYNECLKIRKMGMGDKHEKVACALVGIGNVKLEQEEHSEARRNFETGMEPIIVAPRPKSHWTTSKEPSSMPDRPPFWEIAKPSPIMERCCEIREKKRPCCPPPNLLLRGHRHYWNRS